MPPTKKSTTAVATAAAPPEQTGGKRKGKAPSARTLTIRAGIAANPKMKPKQLAELLNIAHPGLDVTNQDVSQQRQQLRSLGGKPAKKKKTGKAAAETTIAATAATVKTAPAKTGSDVRQVADLVKQLGTTKVRELCDVIDYVSK